MNPTIEISHWNSTCLNCNQGATPNEKTHETVLGWHVALGTKGCGVEWKYMTSPYMGEQPLLQRLRPDLKYVDLFEAKDILE